MKIVNVIGGLGNQMFQCAFAIMLRKKYVNEVVKIDLHHYKHYALHHGFEVDRIFNIEIPVASPWEVMSLSYYMPFFKLSRAIRRFMPVRKHEFIDAPLGVYSPEALQHDGDCYYEGYWQSPRYYEGCREDILKAFTFPEFTDEQNQRWANEMLANDNSVAIHIRRGDYITDKLFRGLCQLDYYEEAIKKVKTLVDNPHFYVFSNDAAWCKEHLTPLVGDCAIDFVTNNSGQESFRDMQLMTYCRGVIIANSSFSWWGAYLNQRKDRIVIAPRKWINTHEAKDIHDAGWILLPEMEAHSASEGAKGNGFSVLMSVYSKEKPAYIREAMESVFNQTVRPAEVVLVEDGVLVDGLYKEIASLCASHPEIKVVKSETNQGLGKSLALGLTHCTYDIVARMDTDDVCKPDRFQRQLEVMDKHPEIDVCGAWIDEFVDKKENVISQRRLPETHDELFRFGKKRNPMNHPVTMFRRQAVESAGGYQHFPLFEDYYLWARMMIQGCRFYCIPDALLWFRTNPEMYRRRGGVKYAMDEVRFEWTIFLLGYINIFEFVINSATRIVTRIIPNSVRHLIYKRIRKK